MSQFDFGTIDPATKSGTQLASDLNSFRDALNTSHGGSSRPSYAVQGTVWLNTLSTPWIIYMYDGAQDIALGTVNAATDKFIPGASAVGVFDDIKQVATTTATGVVELATQGEVDSNTGGTNVVTSDVLNAWIGGGAGGGFWTQTGSDLYYNAGNIGLGTQNAPSYIIDILDTSIIATVFASGTDYVAGAGSQALLLGRNETGDNRGAGLKASYNYFSGNTTDLYIQTTDASSVTNDVVLFDGAGDVWLQTGSLYLPERAAAGDDPDGFGQVWVKAGAPNTLWFTNELGTSIQLGLGGTAYWTQVGSDIHYDTGNVSIGRITFDTWSAALSVMQLGDNAALIGTATQATGSPAYFTKNLYTTDNIAFKRADADAVSMYKQYSGRHEFLYAGSDTADSTATLLTALLLDNDGSISGSAILDEDNMSSNSDVHLATQQSIRALFETHTSLTNEHIDWTADQGATNIHSGNYDGTTDHTLLSNIGTNTHVQIDSHISLVEEHIDWTVSQGVTDIHADNYTDTVYTHPSDGVDPGAALTGANVFSDITVNAAGHVTGSATRALTPADIGAIPAGNIALGTETTGNYVATIVGTANEIEVTGSGGETAAVTIGLPNDVTITGAIYSDSLYTAGYKILDLPSNSTERGAWNPIVSSIRNSAKPIHGDEEFATGVNSISIYDNGSTGTITLTRALASTEDVGIAPPNGTGYIVHLDWDGTLDPTPQDGGWLQNINAEENHTFVQIFQARVTNGATLITNENPQGTNNTTYWLTNNVGTGKYEWYARVSHCGDSGTFSLGGHIGVDNSGSAWDVYIASSEVYDVTETVDFSLDTHTHSEYLLVADIDDAPVDAATTVPISSNWAYDHDVASTHFTEASISITESQISDFGSYVPISGASYIQSLGFSTSWGVTGGVNTGALNAVMGTSTSATWLISGTSGGVFRAGIQVLDSGGTLRIYSDSSSYMQLTAGALTFDTAGAPALLDEVATATNPTFIPNQADANTGIGWNATGELSLIAGAVEQLRITESAGLGQVLLPVQNSAAVPSLAFGDGDTGFYESSDDTVVVSINSTASYVLNNLSFRGVNVNSFYCNWTTPTSTSPAFTFLGDTDTGIGYAGANQLSLIAGGNEIARARTTDFGTYAEVKNLSGTLHPLSGYMILPEGYVNEGVEFRMDHSQTAHIIDDLNPTLTVNDGTDPGGSSLANTFNYSNSYFNLDTYKDVSNNFEYEITGISLSNSSNSNWRSYVLFHSGGASVTTVKVWGLEGDGTTWTELINEAGKDYITPASYTVFATGLLKGLRIRFEGITGNSYIKMVGATSRTSESFAWQMLKTGGTFYGDLNAKSAGVETWSLSQAGTLNLPTGGTPAAPRLAFGTNTGFYEQSSDNLAVTINSTKHWFWASDYFRGNNAAAPILYDKASTATIATLVPNVAASTTGIGGTSGNLSLITGGTEAIRIDSNQNVGIGVAPRSFLTIGSTTETITPRMDFHPGTATNVAGIHNGYAHHDVIFGAFLDGGVSHGYISTGYTASSRKISIGRSSGSDFATATYEPILTVVSDSFNVGVGIDAPVDKLHLHEATSGENYLHITNTTTGTTSADGLRVGIDSAERAYFWNRENTDMFLGTNNTQALLIDATQNVVMGTAALATTATDGFFYMPTCAGIPTGTPATYTGRNPVVYDTTNDDYYIYEGGAWTTVGGGGAGQWTLSGTDLYIASAATDTYFADALTDATPLAHTLHGQGSLGTNIAGANLTIAGGRGTGTGVGGYLSFQTAEAGTTGSILNALTENLRLGQDGNAFFGGVTPLTTNSTYRMQQFAPESVFSSNRTTSTSGWFDICQNLYNDGTGYKYISTASAPASVLELWNGGFWFGTAVSGIGGNSVTTATALNITNTGQITGDVIDTDGAMAANSSTLLTSQSAIVTYVATYATKWTDETNGISYDGNIRVGGTDNAVFRVDIYDGSSTPVIRMNNSVSTESGSGAQISYNTSHQLSISSLEIGGSILLTADGTTAFDISSTNTNFGGTSLRSSNTGGFGLLNETASATNPTVVPNRSDSNTGLGWIGNDELVLIAGGNTGLYVDVRGVGIGNTSLETWWSAREFIQMGSSLSLSGNNSGSAAATLSNNHYQNNTNAATRIVNGYAQSIDFLTDGTFNLNVTGNGNAGVGISWINAISMDSTGQVFLPQGVLKLAERADATGNTTGYGQIWAKTDDTLWFTSEGGVDTQLNAAAAVDPATYHLCTADTTLNNSATSTAITGLSQALSASTNYAVEIYLELDQTAAGAGISLVLDVGTSSLGNGKWEVTGDVSHEIINQTNFTGVAGEVSFTTNVENNISITFRGWIKTSGAFTSLVRFSQATAVANNTTIKAGSWAKFTEIT